MNIYEVLRDKVFKKNPDGTFSLWYVEKQNKYINLQCFNVYKAISGSHAILYHIFISYKMCSKNIHFTVNPGIFNKYFQCILLYGT